MAERSSSATARFQAADLLLRPPSEVARLDRLGAAHSTRLSFMRSLLRLLAREGWQLGCSRRQWDEQGYGWALYVARGPERRYSLVAFTDALADKDRSDRVIAERWDASFALLDGEAGAADIERLRAQVPLQEKGRVSRRELVLSRANKSVRMFEYVCGCLAEGRQPDRSRVLDVGYLMRTTAVYGNGKFGLADRSCIADRSELAGPFRAELLAVYLIRAFTHDLVNYLARVRGGRRAVELDPEIQRFLGIGNSTGLGMAPFLNKHPQLLHRWLQARERALSLVCGQPEAIEAAAFIELLQRARAHVAGWRVADRRQSGRIEQLSRDLELISRRAERILAAPRPWAQLVEWASEAVAVEAQEMLFSLVLEPHGDLIDHLEAELAFDEYRALDASMKVGELLRLLERDYAWALAPEPGSGDYARFWYVSEEKLEPRIGWRQTEPGSSREMPLGVARALSQLQALLRRADPEERTGRFAARFPQARHWVRRVQTLASTPYGEVRDNLLASSMRPLDLLRGKLAMFGATKFDPQSDMWLRIHMFQGAPLPSELASHDECAADDWLFPALQC